MRLLQMRDEYDGVVARSTLILKHGITISQFRFATADRTGAENGRFFFNLYIKINSFKKIVSQEYVYKLVPFNIIVISIDIIKKKIDIHKNVIYTFFCMNQYGKITIHVSMRIFF